MADLAHSNWRKNIVRKLPMVFIGKVLPVCVLLLITVIYSRKLNYEDYGRYQTMWVLISLAGTLLLFGLPSIILSWSGANLVREIRQHLKKIALVFSLLLLVCVLLIWFATGDYSLREKILLMLLLLLQTACIVTDTCFIKFNLFKPYLVISAVYAALFFLVHLVFIYSQFVLGYLILSLAVLSMVKFIASFMLLRSRQQAQNGTDVSFSLNHWLYTGLNEAAGMLGRWLDKIVLLYLLTASEFAIYFNGSFEIPLFAVLVSAMENVMLANISQDAHNKQNSIHIFKESFKLLSLIAFPIFCFFLFSHNEFYEVIFHNKYNASIPVFIVSLFLIPLRITHYGVILQSYGKGNRLLMGSVIDLLISLLLMALLYPFYGSLGIMLALVISTYLQVGYYLFVSAKIVEVSVFQLIPVRYLALLMAGLLVSFYAISFLRPLIDATSYLLLSFAIAGSIIIVGVGRYFLKERR